MCFFFWLKNLKNCFGHSSPESVVLMFLYMGGGEIKIYLMGIFSLTMSLSAGSPR